jgi:CO/xanthine dehydrogenase FAD-binding subunit
MKLCEFIRPASLAAARDNLRELGPKGMILAGGTALHFMQDHTPVTAVDITRLGLSFIKPEGDFYNIGATTPLADIQRYRAPRWAMHEICRRISTHQIRTCPPSAATSAACFPGRPPVVLLAMDARMAIYSGKEQEFGADEYSPPCPPSVSDGNILTSSRCRR